MSKILVTGIAGFIGFTLSKQLLSAGHEVVGIDNINHYYDPKLKYARLETMGILPSEIKEHTRIKSKTFTTLQFIKMDLQDRDFLNQLFQEEAFEIVYHLAAQPGVRYSIDHPFEYINSNIVGFMNVLEACRWNPVKHLIYASSSSVYGNENETPYSETANVDHPVSLYAATKKSTELIAYSYSHLYGIPATGTRLFTVYGPWGRPDMAPYLFMNAIRSDRPIKVFNQGNLMRDFTYVDDVVACLIRMMDSPSTEKVPYAIYNVGNSAPVKLMYFIETIEKTVGKVATKEYLGMQPGDVYATCADMTHYEENFGVHPYLSIEEGIAKMYDWFQQYNPL